MPADPGASPRRRRRPRNAAREARGTPRARRRRGRVLVRAVGGAALAYLAAILVVPAFVPPPPAVGIASPPRTGAAPRYLVDDSGIDAGGERRLEQAIFDEVLAAIARAERLVHVDMFLFNDWQGPDPETHRALADALADALVERRAERPTLAATLVTDPINTVYGGRASERLAALEAAGVRVVLTDLVPLQDSNRLWSGLWRHLVRPFGNDADGGWLPNPLGPGEVTLRSWLALANFKANHRKLVVADDGRGVLRGIVTSANPHDGSSAHRNTALAFEGVAARDLLEAERVLLVQNGATEAVGELDRALAAVADDARAAGEGDAAGDASGADRTAAGPLADGEGVAVDGDAEEGGDAVAEHGTSVQVLGERRIEAAALGLLGRADRGDRVDLAMFYLSDRDVVAALVAARRRGARVRVLLDVNRDAFGRAKNGVPNRPVAAELVAEDVAVRWCATRGEQCHAKQLYVGAGERHALLLGSGNFTRRNLHDLNLETDVRVEGAADDAVLAAARAHFDRLWDNTDGLTYSDDYEMHADESPWLTLQYRVMEATGLSTF